MDQHQAAIELGYPVFHFITGNLPPRSVKHAFDGGMAGRLSGRSRARAESREQSAAPAAAGAGGRPTSTPRSRRRSSLRSVDHDVFDYVTGNLPPLSAMLAREYGVDIEPTPSDRGWVRLTDPDSRRPFYFHKAFRSARETVPREDDSGVFGENEGDPTPPPQPLVGRGRRACDSRGHRLRFQHQEPDNLAGWLLKRTGSQRFRLHQFQRRWARVERGTLAYFKAPSHALPQKAAIILSQFAVDDRHRGDTVRLRPLEQPTQGNPKLQIRRSFEFRFQDGEERLRWAEALVAHGAMRLWTPRAPRQFGDHPPASQAYPAATDDVRVVKG